MAGQTKKIIILMAATLSSLLLLRVITVSPVVVDAVVSCCTYPFVLAQQWLVKPVQDALQRRKTVAELTTLVEGYQQLLDEARAETIALQAMVLHAQQTEELNSFAQRYVTDTMILAQVMLKQFSDTHHFCIVNAGAQRGVALDMIAVYNNCLIGRVTEVHPWYSKVTLISDCLSKVPVICATTKTQGIHEGYNSLEGSQLEFVSHLQPLQVGDRVLSSGDGLVYPKGFAVGKIREFTLDSLGLNYVVGVEPLLDMRTVDYCYLVAKGAEYRNPAPETVVTEQ